MALKYSKKKSYHNTEQQNAWHRQHRGSRRAGVIAKLGGECIECATTENLWFWYTWKPGEQGLPLGRAIHRSDKMVSEVKLGRYQLLCRAHWFMRRDEGRPQRQHGRASTYAGSGRIPCRCKPCTNAWNEYTKKWHRERNQKKRTAMNLLKKEAFKKMFT